MSNTELQGKKNAPDEGAGKHEQVDCIPGGTEPSSQNKIVSPEEQRITALESKLAEILTKKRRIEDRRAELVEKLKSEESTLASILRGDSTVDQDYIQQNIDGIKEGIQEYDNDLRRLREEHSPIYAQFMRAKNDYRAQIEREEAEAKRMAAHLVWLENLTPADVPSVAIDDLFSLAPELLAHVTVEQVDKLPNSRRKDFSPEQAEALAGAFAEVDELRRQKELARLEARRVELDRKWQAELDELLEEMDIVPFTDDDDDDDEEDHDATPMLLDGHLPANCVTLLYGPAKHGKTTVAAGMARTLATGQPVFPSVQPTCGPMNGIVVTSEDSAAQFKVILRAYRAHDGEVAEGAIYPFSSEAPLMVQCDGEWIASEALDQLERLIIRTRSRFVFLDHLGTLAYNMNIKSDDDMRPLLRKLSKIAKEHEVAVILIHHGATDDPYGSVYLQNLPRNLLRVKRCNRAVQLTQKDINHRAPMPTVKLERVGAILREVTAQDAEEPTVEAQDQAQDQQPAVDVGALLVDWLVDHPEALITPDALRVGLGADAHAVLEYLRDQIPGLKNSEAKAAALACVEAGTLALVERKIERKPKMILAVQPE